MKATDKYNPYTLSVKDGEYYISFKEGRGMSYCTEIAEELYILMDSFELEDLSVMNEKERHIIQAEFSKEIKKRIELADAGAIFLTSDFTDIATTTTVRKCLGRLMKSEFGGSGICYCKKFSMRCVKTT